jgi:hypothetical protein
LRCGKERDRSCESPGLCRRDADAVVAQERGESRRQISEIGSRVGISGGDSAVLVDPPSLERLTGRRQFVDAPSW